MRKQFSLLNPRVLLALLALAAIVLGGCSSSGSLRSAPAQAVLADPDGVTLPTRRCANYFLVEAYLNGRGPFTMVLDTGSSQTVVSPRIADSLKADARPVNMYAEGSQGQRQDISRIVTVRELRLGGAVLSGFEAITLDLARIQAALGSGIDGILGYRAFEDVLLTVDYPNSTVRVRRGELGRSDKTTLPLIDSDLPTIEARVGGGGGRKRTFLLDTGKAGGISLSDFDRQEFSSPPAMIAMGVAVGGSYVLRAGRLAGDITLGDIVFHHPVVEKSEASDLIGADALKTFCVTFDQRRRRVRLERVAQESIAFSPIRGIGIGFDFREGFWTVSRVFPGLPAEAVGLQPGDGVIRLAGRRLRDLACIRPSELFASGDAIDITVVRERRCLEFKVPIVTLVP